MVRTVLSACLACLALLTPAYSQDVIIPRDTSSSRAPVRTKEPAAKREQATDAYAAKEDFPKALPVKESFPKAQAVREQVATSQSNVPPARIPAIAQPPKSFAASAQPAVAQTAKASPANGQTAKAQSIGQIPKSKARLKQTALAAPALARVGKAETISQSSKARPRAQLADAGPETISRPVSAQAHQEEESALLTVNSQMETAFIKLADGFDFPVGKPDGQGYYKARGFRSHGHLGEDWDGVRGGDTDLGDPIYSIGAGVVVFARDCHMGWGNVVIVRHSYRESGTIKNIDALYAHLDSILVHRGQAVLRGQKIATLGNAHGLYDAHLHLEIRKNLEIGMSRAAFARDFSNYYDPSQFISSHRHLQTGGGTYRVAMNTFVRDSKINFDKARNYSHSHYRGGSSESAAALKRAVASQH